MKKIVLGIGLLLSCFLAFSTVWSQESNDSTFLALSDLHFNPYDSCNNQSPCQLLEELRRLPVDAWPSTLTRFQLAPSGLKADVNFPLLHGALEAAKQQGNAQNIRFVVVLGDYLAHSFHENFVKYSHEPSDQAYRQFVKKVFAFLNQELSAEFPQADVFLAVGNNDSYSLDYAVEPNGEFYNQLAQSWPQLTHDSASKAAIKQGLPLAGYYAVNLPKQSGIRIISVNSVLFSPKAIGTNVADAAETEFKWLEKELENVTANQQKALILMHIPPGIDVFATLKKSAGPIVLWKSPYADKFVALLKNHSSNIMGVLAGHFHTDTFQVPTEEVFISGVPAISPLFGNNPGFKIYTYANNTKRLENYTVYKADLKLQTGWVQEYNFNDVYQPACTACELLKGMKLLTSSGALADQYVKYFDLGNGSQPISLPNKWLPYYWCAVHQVNVDSYQRCVSQNS